MLTNAFKFSLSFTWQNYTLSDDAQWWLWNFYAIIYLLLLQQKLCFSPFPGTFFLSVCPPNDNWKAFFCTSNSFRKYAIIFYLCRINFSGGLCLCRWQYEKLYIFMPQHNINGRSRFHFMFELLVPKIGTPKIYLCV